MFLNWPYQNLTNSKLLELYSNPENLIVTEGDKKCAL